MGRWEVEMMRGAIMKRWIIGKMSGWGVEKMERWNDGEE
jgi:hypothetical protein